MRRALRITLIVVIAVVVLVVGAGAAGLAIASRTPAASTLDAASSDGWSRVALGGDTISADGSDYGLLVRDGDPERLMVYFSGGGAAWDAEMAAAPITLGGTLTGSPGYYFDSIPWYKTLLLGGILGQGAENPFADWTVVYVPYSTGDFHVGAVTTDYDGTTVHHAGRANAEAALAWIAENAAQPEHLLIAGESAGGFGAAFWADRLLEEFPAATATLYIDSSFLESDRWPGIVDDVWQADLEATVGIVPEADLIGGALRTVGAAHPELAVLQSHTPLDGTLIYFNALLDGAVPDAAYQQAWSARMHASIDALRVALPRYGAFIADEQGSADGTTTHTLSGAETAFTARNTDGDSLADWLFTTANR